MHARNRRTGAPITGTLEKIYGDAKLIAEGFGRDGDGRITYEHEGWTRLFWDSSEQVTADGDRIYLDENDEHVAESAIELHGEDGTPEPETPPRPRPAPNGLRDPDAAARGCAERFIASMAAEVDDYHEQLAAARETGRAWGEEEAEKAITDANEAFVRTACAGLDGVDVATGLVDLRTAQEAEAPIVRHVDTAVIRLEGPNAIRIRCRRDGQRFRVEEVSAREYGRTSRIERAKTAPMQADVYANAILHACGL